MGSAPFFGRLAASLWLLRQARRRGPIRRKPHRPGRPTVRPSKRLGGASFARLKVACLADDAVSAYRELGIWARCAGFGTMPALCEREPAL